MLFPHLCGSRTQDVDQQLWPGADSNIRLHLIKLFEEKKVTRSEGEGGQVRWSLDSERARL